MRARGPDGRGLISLRFPLPALLAHQFQRAPALRVKTEVKCLQITEVRCPLFTGYRVQSSRMKRL